MDSILRYEKKLYFPTRKDFWVSRITREDNYLIWKYQYYLRKEENAGNKLLVYWYRRRKNQLGSRRSVFSSAIAASIRRAVHPLSAHPEGGLLLV